MFPIVFPSNMQPYASSFSQFIYNILGYFLSPIFSAFIMDSFDDHVEGMKWGFRINELMCIFGVIFVVLMMLSIEWPKKERHHHKEPQSGAGEVKMSPKANAKKFDEFCETDLEVMK